MTTVWAEPLTPTAFAPFGRVVAPPAVEPDAAGAGWRWWAETVLLAGDGRPWGVGYLDLEPAAPMFDWAERHLRTAEAMFATSGDVLVYVAAPEPPDHPAPAPRTDAFRVFRVPAGSGVVLDPGVWHGAPLAVSHRTSALVLILEGTGRHDVTLVRFPDTPVRIETAEVATEE